MRWVARVCLSLVVLGACATPRVPAEYVDGWSVCSMDPRRTRCACEGELEMATKEDNERSTCGHTISFCRGRVHDCVVVPRGQ